MEELLVPKYLEEVTMGMTDSELADFVDRIRRDYPCQSTVAAHLAKRLAASGRILAFPGSVLTADVASTGGATSLSTLLTPLFFRAAGVLVPKLGVPGRPAGGVDCLAQIPGYQTELNTDAFQRVIGQCGYAHGAGGVDTAPLDGRLFNIRRAVGGVNVPTLVAASILSKKIASGVKIAGLDIRMSPYGNFGADECSAKVNGQMFVRAAKMLAISATAILTDGRFPYQPYVGRRESLWALSNVFADVSDPWLRKHTELCRTMAISCLPASLRSRTALAGPRELRLHFEQNLAAQGSSLGQFEELVSTTISSHTRAVYAANDGFCCFPPSGLRSLILDFQRKGVSQYPDPVGVALRVPPGSWIQKGELLATVRADAEFQDEFVARIIEEFPPQNTPSSESIEVIHG